MVMEGMEDWIRGCERALCASSPHCSSFQAYLAALQPSSSAGQCTAIWPAGALAYRCRTCQLTNSSAVCLACFKAGDHESHDWIQYRSPSGGCCDCGDTFAWRHDGCCPAHQPGRRTARLEELLGPRARAVLEAVLSAALARLTVVLGQCTGSSCSQEQRKEAVCLITWLMKLASVASLRRPMCELLSRSLPSEDAQRQQQQAQEQADLQSADPVCYGTEPIHALAGVPQNLTELGPEAAEAAYLAEARDSVGRLLAQQPALAGFGQRRTGKAGQDSLLCRWVQLLRSVHPDPLHHLTSLMLLLLYEPDFKYDTAVYLMDQYPPILSIIAGLTPPGQAASIAIAAGTAGQGTRGRSRSGGLDGGARHPLCGVLDRVVVQVFNSEEVTVRLVREQGILEAHLAVMNYLTGAFVDGLGELSAVLAGGHAAGGPAAAPTIERELEERLGSILDAMRRLASDFATIMHHAQPAQRLVSSRELWTEAFLGRFVRPLQAILPHRRKVQGDAEERSAALVALACSAEFVVHACVWELVATLAGTRSGASGAQSAGLDAGDGPDKLRAQQVDLLYEAAKQTLEACEEWCADRLARGFPASAADPADDETAGRGRVAARRLDCADDIFLGLLEGALEASPHLPFHRTVGAFLQALLVVEQQGGAAGQLARHRMQQLVGLHASLDEGSAWRPISRYLLLQQAFANQILSRWWLRNGEDVVQVELFVLNGRELTDIDVLMSQVWMAAEDPDVVLYDTMAALGGKQLLLAAGITPPASRVVTTALNSSSTAPSHHTPALGAAGGSIGSPPASTAAATGIPFASLSDPAVVACSTEAMRWLVAVLRERSVAGLAPRERLRIILVQWLALRDWTYNQLQDLLPQELQHRPDMEEVLAEVATFRAASLSQSRQYSLRREAWELFCPTFVHYTPTMRSRAWEAAMTGARMVTRGTVAAAGTGVAGATTIFEGRYLPHWQLRRPRYPVPASLDSMQRVLEAEATWRLVAWVLQAYLRGSHRLPEDALLAALNLLALQLHRVEDLLGRWRLLTGTQHHSSSSSSNPQQQEQKHEQHQNRSQDAQQGNRDTNPELEAKLRHSLLTAAQALTASPAVITAVQLQHKHSHHQHQYPHHRHQHHRVLDLAASQAAASGRAPGPGLTALLDSLLSAHAEAEGQGAGSTGVPPANTSAGVSLGPESLDCVQWLQRQAHVAAEACQAAVCPPGEGQAPPGPSEGPDRTCQNVPRASECSSTGSRPASAAAAGEAGAAAPQQGEVEAVRRKELARQRQAEMMARLRAQQEAFLRRATGVGGGVAEEDSSEADDSASTSDDDRPEGGTGAVSEDGRVPAPASAPASGAADVGAARTSLQAEGLVGSESNEDSGESAGELEPEDGPRGDGESGGSWPGSRRASRQASRERSIPLSLSESTSRDDAAARSSATPSVTATATARDLPLGRWLPEDLPDPECVVCREGAGSREGPLAYIAHVAVCSCLAAPLQQVRPWHDDPTVPDPDPWVSGTGGYEPRGPVADAIPDEDGGGERAGAAQHAGMVASAVVPGGAGSVPGARQQASEGPALSGATGGSAPPKAACHVDDVPARGSAKECWLSSWRRHGPCVSEVDLAVGMHVHCCGHLIHTNCFARFVAGQLRQYLAGVHFPGSHLVLLEMSEFLCPVCRRLANCIVPAAPFEWRGPTAAGVTAAEPLRSSTNAVSSVVATPSAAAAGGYAQKSNGEPASGLSSGLLPKTVGPTSHPVWLSASVGAEINTFDGCLTSTSQPSHQSPAPPVMSGDGSTDTNAASAADRALQGSPAEPAVTQTAAADVLLDLGGKRSPGGPMGAHHQALGDTGIAGPGAMQGAAALRGFWPPVGHPNGLGATQALLAALPSVRALATLGPPPVAGGPPCAGAPLPGSRYCVFERTFGRYGEIVNIVTHQMTREGANHMGQMERALEARARLTQLRTAADRSAAAAGPSALANASAPVTASAAVAARPAVRDASGAGDAEAGVPASSAVYIGTPEPDTATAGTGAGSIPQASPAESAPAVSEDAPRSGGVESAALANRSVLPQVLGIEVSASGNALPGVMPKDHPGSSSEAEGGSGGRVAMAAAAVAVAGGAAAWPPGPPPLPCLSVSSHRGAEVTAAWKGAPMVARVWMALAHNLAHFEAVRRPVGFAPCGVLGSAAGTGPAGGAVTAASAVPAATPVAVAPQTPTTGESSCTAASNAAESVGAAGPSGSVDECGSSGSGSGGAAGQDAKPQLTRPLPGSAAGHDGFVTGLPSVEAAHWRALQALAAIAVCGGGRPVGPSWGAPTRGSPTEGKSPTGGSTGPAALLAPFQDSLRWLLCDLATLHVPAAATSDSCPARPADRAVHSAAAWASFAPPAPLPTDFTFALLPPYRPEIAVPRLVASQDAAGVQPAAVSGMRTRGSHAHTSAYVHAFSIRRLAGVEDLVADPMLLALELLAVGLSGLSGAPAPPDIAPALPSSPQQLLRAVLRVVWPVQVLQGALWGESPAHQRQYPPSSRRGSVCARASVSPSHSPDLMQLYRSALRAVGAVLPGVPPGGPGSEPCQSAGLVPGCPPAGAGSASAARGGDATSSAVAVPPTSPSCRAAVARDCAETLALGSLAASVLPFLVRMYALDCALARRPPDAALMAHYAALPVGLEVMPEQSGGKGPGQAGPGAEVSREAAADVAAASCTIGLAGQLTAALELTDVVTALEEPLLLSRRRAVEAAALTGTAGGVASWTGEPGPSRVSEAGTAGGAGLTVSQAALEDAALSWVLARWCGPRALALAESAVAGTDASMGTQSSERGQGSPGAGRACRAGPDAAGPGARGEARLTTGGSCYTAGSLLQHRAPWHRGLLAPPTLIPLPRLFQTLFLHFADVRCPECGTTPDNPALCLLTGRYVCNMWRGCADGRGGGLLHAREHCGATALLLSLRSTRVMALRGNRLAVCQSPYLDAHGDEDPDLRRGRPLYLDPGCYRQLARLWGSAALEFDTQLLHNSRTDLVGL